MILVDIQAPCYNVSLRKRGTRCITSKLRGAHLEGSKSQQGAERGVQNSASKFAPRSIRPLNTRRRVSDPSKWARRVLEQCNMCPTFSWRHSYGDKISQKNPLKLKFSFFKGNFSKTLSFQRSIHQIGLLFKEKKIVSSNQKL